MFEFDRRSLLTAPCAAANSLSGQFSPCRQAGRLAE
jgi:hypothetical protein